MADVEMDIDEQPQQQQQEGETDTQQQQAHDDGQAPPRNESQMQTHGRATAVRSIEGWITDLGVGVELSHGGKVNVATENCDPH
ncbi:hypothetical protein BN1723_009222 [Verticillium longisporum]|uniref:Uncharacterized protein n=1 Tax=Verticillium longisporum TaxID=100787 RepID=A0A0G4KNI1_VERLO|nr:hypothetical protein BN1723_009222 [Verticillium longisporum]